MKLFDNLKKHNHFSRNWNRVNYVSILRWEIERFFKNIVEMANAVFKRKHLPVKVYRLMHLQLI